MVLKHVKHKSPLQTGNRVGTLKEKRKKFEAEARSEKQGARSQESGVRSQKIGISRGFLRSSYSYKTKQNTWLPFTLALDFSPRLFKKEGTGKEINKKTTTPPSIAKNPVIVLTLS
jgi:hypothetical protein